MSKIPTILEQQLKEIRPTGFDAAFLDRLTACAEGHGEVLSGGEKHFESRLGTSAARQMPTALQEKLMESIGDTAFSVDGTIVLFNKGKAAPSSKPKRSNFLRFNIAAAAAVALLGSLAALYYPAASQQGPAVADQNTETESAPIIQSATANFVPASYDRNLSSTRDEGVVWNGMQPYRVYGMTYEDKATVENTDGFSIQVEQPNVEHVLIPEKID